MIPFIPPALIPAFPEIFLGIMAMIMLMLGVARKEGDYRTVSNFSLFALLAVAAVLVKFSVDSMTTFNGMFLVDRFGTFMKFLVVVGAAMCVFMTGQVAHNQRIARFEYPVLMLFSTLGMMLMISANDLMSLYMGLELQSLPLYVLAAFQRDSLRSTEAGLKYFVLGALSSGMLLYGASLIYGYTGATNFTAIGEALAPVAQNLPLGVVVGVVLLLSGLAFKIAAVPFHMWTPDVYEGAPTPVTAFFAIVPKVAAIALFLRVFMGPFGDIAGTWQQIIVFISIASMLLGSVAAIAQSNIKRMLAYSSIGHMGYALIGLAAATGASLNAVMIYMTIYVVTSVGAFAVVMMMKQKERSFENISDLAGLASRQPLVALAMGAIMFSLAGIPPLAGFFGKLFIFQAAIDAKLYTLAVIGVLASVISAYYYLRVIKVMYFDTAPEEGIDKVDDQRLKLALTASFAAIVLFVVFPGPLLKAAGAASMALIR
jgi:NADH-quinone oxidoreductase subunit N